MDEHRYKVANNERQKRLDDLSQSESLDGELAVARLLLQEALDDHHATLANALLGTIGKLRAAHTADQIRRRELIRRDELMQFAKFLASVVAAKIKHLPHHAQILEEILADFSAGFAMLSKPKLDDQQLRLEPPRD